VLRCFAVLPAIANAGAVVGCAHVLLQEDILSIFPIERSQAMEEFEKQIEANKAEHDPIVEIHKVKKKIKDNHQLLKQVMQQLNGNSTFGTR
jgi:hypothetical protein